MLSIIMVRVLLWWQAKTQHSALWLDENKEGSNPLRRHHLCAASSCALLLNLGVDQASGILLSGFSLPKRNGGL
jgi:hypothetical protein